MTFRGCCHLPDVSRASPMLHGMVKSLFKGFIAGVRTLVLLKYAPWRTSLKNDF